MYKNSKGIGDVVNYISATDFLLSSFKELSMLKLFKYVL